MKKHGIVKPDDKLKVLDMYVVDAKLRVSIEIAELKQRDDIAGQEQRPSTRYY